jgi:ATP-dependent Lhr-like helicase
VVFRDLLTRESVAPPWRVLLPVFRRLEARGEIRGGRFITGVGGEQFARSDAVEWLRATRDAGPKPEHQWVVVSAADPVNLAGIILPGARVPAIRSNHILFKDGEVAASLQSNKVSWHLPVEPERASELTDKLVRLQHSSPGHIAR